MTPADFTDLIPKRNPATHAKHRREVFWQITFPLILGGILLLGMCSLTTLSGLGGGEVGLWRDVSLIGLILPTMALALIPLALLAGLVYGLSRLLTVLPGYAHSAQDIVYRLAARVVKFANSLAAPAIRLRSLLAGIQRMLDSLR